MSNLYELFRAESTAMLSLYGGSAPGFWRRELGLSRARLDTLRFASGWVEELGQLKIELFDGNLWGETLPQLVARNVPVGGGVDGLQSRAGHAPAPRNNSSPLPRRMLSHNAHTPRRTGHMPTDADFITSRDSDTQSGPRERRRRSFVEATRARRGSVNEPRAHADVGATRPAIPGMPSAHAQGAEASLPREAPPDARRHAAASNLSGERRGTATPDALGLKRDVAAAPALGGNVSRVSNGLRAESRAGTAADQLVWEAHEPRPTRDDGVEYTPRSSLDVSMLPLMADQALLSRLQQPTRLQTHQQRLQRPPQPFISPLYETSDPPPHETFGSLPHETKVSPVYARTHHEAATLEVDASSRSASTAKSPVAAGRRFGRSAEFADSARRLTHAPGAQAKASLRHLSSLQAEPRAAVVAGGAWLDEMFVRVARAMWRPGEGLDSPRSPDPSAISRQRSLSLGGPEATRELLLRVTAQAAPGAVAQGASKGATSQSTRPGATAERLEADRVDVNEGRRPVPLNGNGHVQGTTPTAVVNDKTVNASFEPHASTFEVAPLLTLPPFLSDELPTLPSLLGDEPQGLPVAVPLDSRGTWAAQPPEAEDLDALAEKIKLIIDEQARRHGIDV